MSRNPGARRPLCPGAARGPGVAGWPGYLHKRDVTLLDTFVPLGGGQGELGRCAGVGVLRETHAVNTPVVVLSVLTNTRVHDELAKLNVSAILRKPVLPSELKESVEHALGID